MNDNVLRNISLNILLGDQIYDLYKNKCEALIYLTKITSVGDDFSKKKIVFPSLNEIINEYWDTDYITKNHKLIHFTIYDDYEEWKDFYSSCDDWNLIKKCYFIFGVLNLDEIGIKNYGGETKKVFIVYEKKDKKMQFLSEEEIEYRFGEFIHKTSNIDKKLGDNSND